MGAPDIMAAVARKYDIQEQQANSEDRLRQAQAAGIYGAMPSENALRNSQAYETQQRGQTIGPTARASIASTMAGIPLQQAQAGYMGAQTRTLNDMTAPGGDALGNWWLGQMKNAGVQFAPEPAAPPARTLATPSPDVTKGGISDGTSLGDLGNTGGTPGMVTRMYAGGSADVPAPGQTITSGSWTGPTSPTPPPAPLPPTPATGGDLRRRLGLGVVRAAAGDSDVGGFGSAQQQGAADVSGMGQAVITPNYQRAPGADAMGGSGYGGEGGAGASGAPGGNPGAHVMSIAPGALPTGSFSHDGKLHVLGSETPDQWNAYARGTGRAGPPKGHGAPMHAAPPPQTMAPMMPQMAPPPGGPPPGGGSMPPGGMPSLMSALQAAMGAPQVPGRRPPPGTPQDTVPAVLTPGEAVLTPGAAQAAGRGNISRLNAQHPPAGPAGAPGEARPQPQPGRGMPTKKPAAKGQHVHVHIHMGG